MVGSNLKRKGNLLMSLSGTETETLSSLEGVPTKCRWIGLDSATQIGME